MDDEREIALVRWRWRFWAGGLGCGLVALWLEGGKPSASACADIKQATGSVPAACGTDGRIVTLAIAATVLGMLWLLGVLLRHGKSPNG